MLDVAFTSREADGRGRTSARRTQRKRFVLGGVAFELLGDRESAELPAECARRSIAGDDVRARASAVCAIHRDETLLLPPERKWAEGNSVTWTSSASDDGAVLLHAPGLRAQLEPIGTGRYAVTARVAPGDDGTLALLRGVSSAIVHREGGLVLHAAAAELDGQGFLFVGPSGAGKSTAVRQTLGASCFAYDHVAVVPGPSGWLAWGLPGGTAAQAPEARQVAYPLASILRVRKGGGARPVITALRGIEALFAVRESVECADGSPGGEDVYLRIVTELCSQVEVAAIATVLGRPNDDVLRAVLARGPGGLRA